MIYCEMYKGEGGFYIRGESWDIYPKSVIRLS